MKCKRLFNAYFNSRLSCTFLPALLLCFVFVGRIFFVTEDYCWSIYICRASITCTTTNAQTKCEQEIVQTVCLSERILNAKAATCGRTKNCSRKVLCVFIGFLCGAFTARICICSPIVDSHTVFSICVL